MMIISDLKIALIGLGCRPFFYICNVTHIVMPSYIYKLESNV